MVYMVATIPEFPVDDNAIGPSILHVQGQESNPSSRACY
jgi:hypothetical protein